MRIKVTKQLFLSALVAITLPLAMSELLSQAVTDAHAQQSADRSGKEVVEAVCATCHSPTAANAPKAAPKIGDRAAWTPRLSHGLDNAVRTAIRGHGGMPPRGDQAALTDNEIRNAIVYMFNADVVPPAESTSTAKTVKAAGNVRTVGSTEVYLGVLPAELLRGYPEGSAERTMHGGVPRGAGNYHVNVSVLDAASKTPIAGATVSIQVEEPGMSSVSKQLQAVSINNTPSYGAYLKLRGKTQYVMIVKVQRPDKAQPVEARFEHRLY
jgi:cytochrome c5